MHEGMHQERYVYIGLIVPISFNLLISLYHNACQEQGLQSRDPESFTIANYWKLRDGRQTNGRTICNVYKKVGPHNKNDIQM